LDIHGACTIFWRKYLDLIMFDVDWIISDDWCGDDDDEEISIVCDSSWSLKMFDKFRLDIVDESFIVEIIGWKYFKILFWLFSIFVILWLVLDFLERIFIGFILFIDLNSPVVCCCSTILQERKQIKNIISLMNKKQTNDKHHYLINLMF
jgi:hypothetical protein